MVYLISWPWFFLLITMQDGLIKRSSSKSQRNPTSLSQIPSAMLNTGANWNTQHVKCSKNLSASYIAKRKLFSFFGIYPRYKSHTTLKKSRGNQWVVVGASFLTLLNYFPGSNSSKVYFIPLNFRIAVLKIVDSSHDEWARKFSALVAPLSGYSTYIIARIKG